MVRTSLLNIPGAAVKAEAAQLGIVWSKLTGIVITSFDDGTAIFVIRSGAPRDAERLLEHLVAHGLAAQPVPFPPQSSPPSDRAPLSPPA
jgi:hypothetical protein